MKNFFYVICILSLFVEKSNAQSALETEFIKQLNVYRKQHKLGPVKYDSQVSQIARYHAKYLVQCSNLNHVVHYDKLPHDEQFDIQDHKELTFEQRSQMLPNKNIWGEIQIAHNLVNEKNSISEIVKSMIDSFDSSPKHKEIMLCEDLSSEFTNIVGVAIVKSEKIIGVYYFYSINVDFGVLINK